MKKTLLGIIAVICCLLTTNSYAQETVTNKNYAISFEKPKSWFDIDKSGLHANLNKFDFSEESLQKILKDNEAEVLIAGFYKYDVTKVSGIIPTIQISARPKPKMSFEQFKVAIINSLTKIQGLEDYKLTREVEEIEIDGLRTLRLDGTFSLSMNNLIKHIRSRIHVIPRDTYFIKVSMSDEVNGRQADEEFNNFWESFKIGN